VCEPRAVCLVVWAHILGSGPCGLDGQYPQTTLNMRSSLLVSFAVLLSVSNAQTHGEGAEGSEMGPVAFMWPADRVWDATHDSK